MNQNESFYYETIATIGDTNLEGNVYWTKFYDWMGKARELLLMKAFPNILDIFKSGIKLITYQTNIKHLKSLYFTDKIKIVIKISDIQNAKLTLSFDFINIFTKELVAKGIQTYIFSNENNKIIKLPDFVIQRLMEILK
jgi:acyl-CoA thioesterase FadM